MDYSFVRKLLKKHEGYREKLYRCPGGKLTIGYGHNIEDLGLDPDVIEHQFSIDIESAVSDCKHLIPGFERLPDSKQAVLVDMMFNLGLPRMRSFRRMLRAVSEGNWEKAAHEMHDSKWAIQVGSRAVELIKIMRGES